MSSTKAVVVLTPNGRRQTVKVNPNTTILQILEEVCKKHGFNPQQYDIKHHNKCLDTTTTFRFSGLPNNAQLELAEATSIRLDSIVTLSLQLESGARLQESFSPNTTLWDVVIQVCPEETKTENLAIIYMRQEIYGQVTMQTTTLKNLGLTNGRALLRLIHRSPEELHCQANVSAPLPAKPVEEKPYLRTFKTTITSEPTQFLPSKEVPNVDESQESNSQLSQIPSNKGVNLIQQIREEKGKQASSSQGKKATAGNTIKFNPEVIVEPIEEKTVAEEDFVFLGKRNAMIFSQITAQTVPHVELPDDFFDLTVNDAKKLLRDLKKQRLQFENEPLQTSALRNLEKSKHQLACLTKYKKSIIRVYFPDQTVLQGTFNASDTISTVRDFVREFLEYSNMDFYLYTTPPKNILESKSDLLEVGCVPNAILHFGTDSVNKDEKYLRSDLVNKFTTPSIASLAAAKIRKETTRLNAASDDDDDNDDEDEENVNVGASTSKDPKYEDYPSKPPKPSDQEPVPKWFKQH